MQIHYGPASLSALSRLPCYFVFRRSPLDTAAVASQIQRHAAQLQQQQHSHAAVPVLLDQPYAHAAASLRHAVDHSGPVAATTADAALSLAPGVPILVADTRPGPLDPIGVSTTAAPQADAAQASVGGSCCRSEVRAVL